MKADVKVKWLDALRSGKYAQGSGWLRSKGPQEEKWCCLGVLCDIVDSSKWSVEFTHGDRESMLYDFGDDSSSALLRQSFLQAVALSAEQMRYLAHLNDGSPPANEFRNVAQWIEENL